MKKVLKLLLWVLLFPPLIGAQETRPLIRFSPFFTKGIGIEETRFVESLIQSYLADFGDVINYFENPPGSSDTGSNSRNRAPDYVLSGSIYLEPEGRVLTLEIHNSLTRTTSSSTTVHRTAGELVLKARSLVEAVFSPASQLAQGAQGGAESSALIPAREQPEPMTERAIAGTWRGESGIEMIYLQQGGRGVAFFSSGAQMSLSYTIDNNSLKIRQNSPNTEGFYYPLPYGVAKQLSAEADPMSWELYLYSGGTHLKGVRISTDAKVEGNLLVEVLPGTSRDIEWIRSAR